jgi:hypothetical protein
LFSGVRYAVAEHGSGAANILFRQDGPVGLFEMFPPGYVSPCFFGICHLMGGTYGRMSGEVADPARGSYRVPLEQLDEALDRWLAA